MIECRLVTGEHVYIPGVGGTRDELFRFAASLSDRTSMIAVDFGVKQAPEHYPAVGYVRPEHIVWVRTLA